MTAVWGALKLGQLGQWVRMCLLLPLPHAPQSRPPSAHQHTARSAHPHHILLLAPSLPLTRVHAFGVCDDANYFHSYIDGLYDGVGATPERLGGATAETTFE